jgi:methionyl-tRNA synthetase
MLQRGEEVAFLTGTDEHGQKIEKAADTNNKDPQAHVDYISEEFKKLWSILEINYDYFVRTSSPQHKAFVTEFFQKVQANGDIYKGEYKGLYCVSCEDFWLEKDLEENDKGEKRICPTHKTTVEEYSQENYFFKLSKYQETLKQYFEDNPDFISPESRKNEVLGWIKEGLRDFPISRTNLSWGIPVPDDNSGQLIYVWFDALLGYISGLGADREKFWKNDSIIHIIGKDILRFHAVYWPAMLMSAGYPLPKKVFGHGFLTKDGMKMGKTLGNVIDPVALSERFGAEAVKYYFLREIVFGRDGDYTDESFIQCLNSDLANNLGNLLNRCLKLVSKYFAGSLKGVCISAQTNTNLCHLDHGLHGQFVTKMNDLNPYFAIELLMDALNSANVHISNVAPWKLLKEAEPGSPEYIESGACLKHCLLVCHRAAFYLAPVMPELSKKIMRNLGYEIDESLSRRELLTTVFSFENILSELPNTISENPEPIFQRLETVSAQ